MKITKEGDLLGGRQFVVRTFTVHSRGQVKYMLSTEPARAVGFRDSYLFFQYHPNLYKLIISQSERDDLISRGVSVSYTHLDVYKRQVTLFILNGFIHGQNQVGSFSSTA